jgi:hypothetical protein
MNAIGALASLALPLVALPALVGGVIRWWLKTKMRTAIEVAVGAAALYTILLVCLNMWLGTTEFAEGEVEGSSFLFLFLAILGIPVAVAVALWVRSSMLRDVKTGA